jgi:hypothetical protein
MEGTLYKSPNGDHYYLTVNGKIIADIDAHPLSSINVSKLSKQNCQEIELMGNKMYTDDDIVDAYMAGHIRGMSTDMGEDNIHPICSEYLNSLKKTEWDVEIVTEPYVKYVSRSLHSVYPPLGIQNKLDKDGCLILRRI